jgi:glycosyltransferase involved in cell wall biosynthesis
LGPVESAQPDRPPGAALPGLADVIFSGSVALVHDYLNQRGGAEKVVLELAELWPDAPIYTSIFRPASTYQEFSRRQIHASFLDRLPVDAGFRGLAPFFPAAFRSLGTLSQDLVISSSSGWAHGVRVGSSSTHVVYCHTPARWLYAPEQYRGWSRRQRLLRLLSPALRRWDRAAACSADSYFVNSINVREKVRRVYGIDAEVVPPPVSVERFTPTPRGERLLVVSRLLPYKRVDLVVAAATRLGIGLDVVGTGPEAERLRALAGADVTFHGTLDDASLQELMQRCRAVCVAGEEDFGIVPIEANAAGKPVVAFARGGALETLNDGFSAAFFSRPTVSDVVTAIRRVDELDTAPEALAGAARRFDRAAFHSRLAEALPRAMERAHARRRGRD